MNEDSENLINLEPIRMLQLFPVRKIKCFQFDLQKYKKLFEALSCTFCQQIFNNPTYLRCSHRFCKDCIEKHIRINDKKSCPICRGELTTKRDSKSDLKLISLISFAFGDANSLQNQIDKINEQATKNIRFVRTKTGIQMQLKRNRTESMDNKSKAIETSSKKRLKKQNEEDDKNEEENKILLFSKQHSQVIKQDNIQLTKNTQQLYVQRSNDLSIQISEGNQEGELKQKRQKVKPLAAIKTEILISNWGNTKSKGAKKKKAEIIQIHSQGSNEIEVTKLSEKGKNVSLQLRQIKQNKRESEQKANNIEESKKYLEEKQKIEMEGAVILDERNRSKRGEQQFFKDFPVADEIRQARKKLRQNWGENYIKNLIKKSNKKCTMKLQLIGKANEKLTPMLEKQQFEISLNTSVNNIVDFLITKFNLALVSGLQRQQMVQISLINKESVHVVVPDMGLTMLDLIELYWKDYRGISVFNIKNTLSNKNQKGGSICINESTPLLCSLFKQAPPVIPMAFASKSLYYRIKVSEMNEKLGRNS